MSEKRIAKQGEAQESIQAKDSLFQDTCAIIEHARDTTYRAINIALTLRNWHLGERIARENLDNDQRAEYGLGIIRQLSEQLTSKYGKGFDRVSIYNYIKFYRLFPSIVDSLSQQSNKVGTASQQLLPWTHYRELIRVTDDAARAWYEQESLHEGWSVRTLHRNIASQYYYRLLQSQNKQLVVDEMHSITACYQNDPQEFIKNPVVAEFLGLVRNTDFSETELESSIITHIQNFVMELGKGYAFVARQQHIRTDMGDFYIDLVFYNYILKCFLLIDLKTNQISHQDVGQMDMYIRMFDQLKRTEGDNPTIGLILCSETSKDMARYSILHDNERLFQAKYMTYLPSVEQLRAEIEQQKELYRLQKDNNENN